MPKKTPNTKDICKYFFELGTLKKFKHSGTKLSGIIQPDSIAEHVYRTAIIGYILAEMEGADANKTTLICLFHDNAEARITDLHKVARKYIDSKKAETNAYKEQVSKLPAHIGKIFNDLFQEYENKQSKEAIIARDADMLETAFQAKEYVDIGFPACGDMIKNVEQCLKTPSAKKIFKEMKKTKFSEWWNGLKHIEKY